MLKVIVSHDVDHLYWSDHMRDLFYPKLCVRETIAVINKQITFAEWKLRLKSTVQWRRNHIDELMAFDKEQGIPSTFFFGMAKGLGMSYAQKTALPIMRQLRDNDFCVGVHGIAYDDPGVIQEEYAAYKRLMGYGPQGIRMHYVRYTDRTFAMLNEVGYAFDSTEFDKKTSGSIAAPYRVGAMWEFPLAIMDVYLPYDAQKAGEITRERLRQAAERDIGYCTVLLHDTNFSAAYPVYSDWYKWLVRYCRENGIGFCSFQEAIRELAAQR